MKSMTNVAKYLAMDNDVEDAEDPEKIEVITAGLVKAAGNLLLAIIVNANTAMNSAANETSTRSEVDVQNDEKVRG